MCDGRAPLPTRYDDDPTRYDDDPTRYDDDPTRYDDDPTRNVSQVDGYLFRSVTQLVKQMCCLLPE